jgi:hypothetical protein
LIGTQRSKEVSIEMLTFVSEFSALKTGVEKVKGLWYKFRMMGIPLDGHTHLQVENMSVVNNSQTLESTLKK